jgi:hypothetical protein
VVIFLGRAVKSLKIKKVVEKKAKKKPRKV